MDLRDADLEEKNKTNVGLQPKTNVQNFPNAGFIIWICCWVCYNKNKF